MKLGGVMTAFFMLAGVAIFGIGLYLAAAKDEHSIDKLAGDLKEVHSRVEAEKKIADGFRAEMLLIAAKIDQFIESRSAIPERPLIPTQVSVNSKETVTVRFDEPVKVEIVETYKPPRVMPKSVKAQAKPVKRGPYKKKSKQ